MPQVFIYESTVGFISVIRVKKFQPISEHKRFIEFVFKLSHFYAARLHHKKEHGSKNDPINYWEQYRWRCGERWLVDYVVNWHCRMGSRGFGFDMSGKKNIEHGPTTTQTIIVQNGWA